MNSKAFVFCLFTYSICVTGISYGQSSSDCIGALTFCSEKSTIPTVPESGDIPDEAPLSCVDHEDYSTWYTFSPTSDGIFNFILTPEDENDDYDWALFDITGKSCSDISTDPSLLVSCNSWGSFGKNGATGISTDEGGKGNSNGPGTTNGPPFNEDLDVQKGHTYVLMVSNWTGNTDGFTIDISGSTAKGLFDSNDYVESYKQEICIGDTPDFEIKYTTPPLPGMTYLWLPTDRFIDPTVERPTLKDPLTKSETFRVYVAKEECGDVATINVEVSSIEYDANDEKLNLCYGNSSILDIGFSGIISSQGITYSWSPEELLDDPSKPKPTTIPLYDTTLFYFNIVNGPCSTNDSISLITHNDTVTADFDFIKNDDPATRYLEVDFMNTSINNVKNLWELGDGTNSNEISPQQHTYNGYDTYPVTLYVESASSYCKDSITKTITYPNVVYPNIITPNGDLSNELFQIKGIKVGTGLNIYNRWGRLVYHSDDYLQDWKGENVPDGNYFYELVYKEEKIYSGHIIIAR